MRFLKSLAFRIFSVFALTLTVLLVLVLMLPHFDSRQLKNISQAEKFKGDQIAKQLSHQLQEIPNDDFRWWIRLDQGIDLIAKQYPNSHFFLVTRDGRVVSSMHIESHLVRNFIGISDNPHAPYKKIYDNLEMLGPFIVNDGDSYYYLYSVHPKSKQQPNLINVIFDHPVVLLLITLLFSWPLIAWFSLSIAKPARRLKIAADEIAMGYLIERPELESGPIEFKSAGISLNKMIHDLDKMMTQQQRLMSDISHELRTPLTRLKLVTALLRRRHGEIPELIRIDNETEKLDNLINELLNISRAQYQQKNQQTLSIKEVWSDMLDDARFEAEQLGKQIQIDIPSKPIMILGEPRSLESALENIIRNAFRYSHQQIAIRFYTEQQKLIIEVDDDGEGVPSRDLDKIFQPFYRTDEARERISGGFGLGLAIVEAVITQHKGQVIAAKSPLGGLRVKVTLPIAYTSVRHTL